MKMKTLLAMTVALGAIGMAITSQEANATAYRSDTAVNIMLEFADGDLAKFTIDANNAVTQVLVHARVGGELAMALNDAGYVADAADASDMAEFKIATNGMTMGDLREALPDLGTIFDIAAADPDQMICLDMGRPVDQTIFTKGAVATDLSGIMGQGHSSVAVIVAKIAALAKVVVASIIAPPPRQMATAT
jgi:hypothetical protein